MHQDRDLHIMEAVPVGWDLETPTVIPYGIVVDDNPYLLHAQHVSEVRADPRDKGGADFGRPDRQLFGQPNLAGCGRHALTDRALPANMPE